MMDTQYLAVTPAQIAFLMSHMVDSPASSNTLATSTDYESVIAVIETLKAFWSNHQTKPNSSDAEGTKTLLPG